MNSKTDSAECAAYHEAQAQTLKEFARLPQMLTQSMTLIEADTDEKWAG